MIGYGTEAQDLTHELSRIEGARSSLVLNRDGTPTAEMSFDELEQIFGSLTGAIFRTISKAMQRTGFGDLQDLVITADNGTIQAVAAGEFVLVVVGDRDSNIGLIRLGMRRIAATRNHTRRNDS